MFVGVVSEATLIGCISLQLVHVPALLRHAVSANKLGCIGAH